MKKIGPFCLIIFIVFLQGCARLDFNEPFRYIPTLPEEGTLDLTVGVAMVVDKRPEEDRKATKEIRDLNEKVTSTVLKDLRYSGVFTKVRYPPRGKKDNLLLKGEIERFTWSKGASEWSFAFPLIGLFIGTPYSTIKAEASMKFYLIDPASGKTVAEAKASHKIKRGISIYDIESEKAGGELAECFRVVMGKIKEQIANDKKLRKMSGGPPNPPRPLAPSLQYP